MPGGSEIDKLYAAFRDNPRSTAFLPLAEALVDAERPQEAIDVLGRGLATHPDSAEGRLVLGRAHIAMHGWKEAQAELVKVVKLDRNHHEGFALLGEVLLRRGDFERALPILQQALNLKPADAKVLAMLRRAREGRPLDPPPPVPSGDAAPAADEHPRSTRMGPPAPPSSRQSGQRPSMPPPPPGGGRATMIEQPPPPSSSRGSGQQAARRDDDLRMSGVRQTMAGAPGVAPPPNPRMSGVYQSGVRPGQQSGVRPPGTPGSKSPWDEATVERPKIASTAQPNKQTGQVGEAMRRSAAMGEDFLNQLLVGGLLSVPNVEARQARADSEPETRWGRSGKRAFLWLWVVTGVALVGGGGWYFVSKSRKEAAITRALDDARKNIAAGGADEMAKASAAATQVLKIDAGHMEGVALLAEARALGFYEYGLGTLEEADGAVLAASQGLKTLETPDESPAARPVAIARAAKGLAALEVADDPLSAAAELRTDLDAALVAAPEDGRLLWLDGELEQATGDRVGAKAAYEKADAGGNGPVAARVALGDLALDEGDAQTALAAYEAALQRSPSHPLALVGRALARIDRSEPAEQTMQDLNVGLAKATGARVEAWKQYALYRIWRQLEDYSKADEALEKAVTLGVSDHRLVVRLALGRVDQGRIVDAAQIRNRIRTKPEVDPVVALLEAELLLARGMAREAVDTLGKVGGVAARLVRGRAYLDTIPPQPKEAAVQFQGVLEIAAGDWRAQAFSELTKIVGAEPEQDTATPYDAIKKAANKQVSGLPRYLQGEADLVLGRASDAKRAFEASLEVKAPQPYAYRARTRLGALLVAAGDPPGAEAMVRKALDQAPDFAPAHVALGRVLVAGGKNAEARSEFEAVLDAGVMDGKDELVYAQALFALNELDAARDACRRAKDKGASPQELLPIAKQIDPALPGELGIAGAPVRRAPARRRGR